MDDHKYPEFRQGWPTLLIDATGNYDSLLLICIGVAALGASLFLTLGPYPNFEEGDV